MTGRDLGKLSLGCGAALFVHLPRLLVAALRVSYYAAFKPQDMLTADPQEHLRRANSLLKARRNSKLLYAAVELRFALERMTMRELLLANLATQRMVDQYDPAKHAKNLRRLAPEADRAQTIYLLNKTTGERFRWGKYKPLDQQRVAMVKGRLGDLLHPKVGLRLGDPFDPWYQATRGFLLETHHWLSEVWKDNTPFFAFEGLDHIEMEEVSPATESNSTSP